MIANSGFKNRHDYFDQPGKPAHKSFFGDINESREQQKRKRLIVCALGLYD